MGHLPDLLPIRELYAPPIITLQHQKLPKYANEYNIYPSLPTNITYSKVNALLVCCRSMQNRNRLQLIMKWIFSGNIPFSQQMNNDSQSIKRVLPASECLWWS